MTPQVQPRPNGERTLAPHAASDIFVAHDFMASPELDIAAELRQVPGLSDLGADVQGELAKRMSQRVVHANLTLVDQGAVSNALLVLVRGATKSVRRANIEGADPVVLDVMRAPGVILDASVLDGRPATATVQTLRSSHVFAIERRALFDVLSRHPSLGGFLLTRAAAEVRAHTRRIDELVGGSVDERVKHMLENLARVHGTPLGNGRFIALPLRRRDIACMVNATTETVSRLLAKFEREGLARSTRDGIWWKSNATSRPTGSATVVKIEPATRTRDVNEGSK